MAARISTSALYNSVLAGIRQNTLALARAQEQLASGKRILRPSDDPTGAMRALSLTSRIVASAGYSTAAIAATSSVDNAASALQNASTDLTSARSLIVQGLSGSTSPSDFASLAQQIDSYRTQLLSTANTNTVDGYLFGGTATAATPWGSQSVGSYTRVLYGGDDGQRFANVGNSLQVALNVPGQDVFGKIQPAGAVYAGLTGATTGITADQGSSFEYLITRHDETHPGAIGSVGVAMVNGGTSDTLLGTQALVIDGVAGTVQLGSGLVVNIPQPTDSDYTDFVVKNEFGGEMHLDFSGYAGGSVTTTVVGDGSISLDGTNFVALDFAQTDLELRNDATGSVLHVNTAGIMRAGREMVAFSGNINVFDVMQGVSEAMQNIDGLDSSEIAGRLNILLPEFDRNESNLLGGLGTLGSLSNQISAADARAQSASVQNSGLLSSIADADFAQVALDAALASQTLQAAQATGAQLIQQTLLNFLR